MRKDSRFPSGRRSPSHDAGIAVEEDKPASERGKYLHPAAFDKPAEAGAGFQAADAPHEEKP